MRQMHRADSHHHDVPTQTDRSESKPYKTRLKIALPSRKQMLALLVFQQAPTGRALRTGSRQRAPNSTSRELQTVYQCAHADGVAVKRLGPTGRALRTGGRQRAPNSTSRELRTVYQCAHADGVAVKRLGPTGRALRTGSRQRAPNSTSRELRTVYQCAHADGVAVKRLAQRAARCAPAV